MPLSSLRIIVDDPFISAELVNALFQYGEMAMSFTLFERVGGSEHSS
jgi:hypothetical protein